METKTGPKGEELRGRSQNAPRTMTDREEQRPLQMPVQRRGNPTAASPGQPLDAGKQSGVPLRDDVYGLSMNV
jgi:hypothetical protein